MPDYRFPGMEPYIAAAGLDGSPAVKAASVWFVARARDALCQLPEARPEHRQEMLDVALASRDSMAAALAALDAAIDDVRSHCFPPTETPNSSPRIAPSRSRKSAS